MVLWQYLSKKQFCFQIRSEDAASKALYKPANVVDINQDGDTDDDWRRSNVDVCLKQLYDTIQAVKPWVRLGMGTFGIWSTQKKAADAYGLTLPSGISGAICVTLGLRS